MCDISGLAPAEVFARLRDAGLGSTPGTAAEVLHDGVRERISPNKLPVARWVEIIEASHHAGLRSSSTVMFGHIEEPWELAEHMRVVRELQERTGGITEFVPLSFIPFQTLLGRTHGVQEISREENLKHTAAFRLALGSTVPNVQASWVKMGLEAATEALRWGVNDLGGTLMEESISRLAGSYHGTRLDPDQLIAAAHAGCFSMALSAQLAEVGHAPTSIRTTARVRLRNVDDLPTIDEIKRRVALALERHPLCRNVEFDIVSMPRTKRGGNWTISMRSIAPDAIWEASDIVSDIQEAYDLAAAA